MKDQRERERGRWISRRARRQREALVKRSHTPPPPPPPPPPPIALPSSAAASGPAAGRPTLGRRSGAELTDGSIRRCRELDRHVQHVLCSQIMSDLITRKISISSAFLFLFITPGFFLFSFCICALTFFPTVLFCSSF